MKRLLKSSAILFTLLLPFITSAQEGIWLTTLENREQLNHITQLNDGNFLVSGRTFEVGAKADLLILFDSNGREITRKSLCEECSSSKIMYTNENSLGQLIHYYSNGDVYRSTLDLAESEFIFNIKEGEFETVDVYDFWENGNWVVLTSTAVRNGVRGILYTLMDASKEGVAERTFNTNAPDITGSIGIGRFADLSFIDGFNVLDDDGVNIGQLDKHDIRGNLLWSKEVGKNLELTTAIASYLGNIFVAGVIEDEEDDSHLQGFIVKYDIDGNFLWEKRFDSPFSEDRSYEESSLRINRIEKIDVNRFLLIADAAGVSRSGRISESMLIHMDPDGNVTDEFRFSAITEVNTAVDMVWSNLGDPVLLANAFNGNSVAGSYLTIGRFPTSSVVESLPQSIEVYPNPAVDILVINSEELNLSEAIFSIYGIGGELINEMPGSGRVDISTLENGLYHLVITSEDSKYRTTFVKTK